MSQPALFHHTPSWQLALLAAAGIAGSGFMAYQAGLPVARLLSAPKLAVSDRQPATGNQLFGRITGAETSSQPADTVTSLKSQVANLVARVAELEDSTRSDVVLGDSTESTPTREEFPPAVNLIRNSSFEENSDGAPRQWNYNQWSNSGNTFTTAEAIRTGSAGLKVKGSDTANFGFSQPTTKMVEGRNYALSIWVKPVNTDSHTVKLSFWDELNNKEASAKTFSFTGTKEWSRIVLQVSNKNTWNGKKWYPMVTVNGLNQGAVYFDDAQLEEASSYTPYHFEGGGATQSHVSVLGDGSVEIDAHGNVYPAVNGVGGLGTGDNKFAELKLSKATIDKNGSLTLEGDITVEGNGTFKGAFNFSGTIKSHLIPDQDSTYDLGSSAKNWRVGYIDQLNLENRETINNNIDSDITFIENNTGGNNTLVFDLNAAADAVELRNDTEDLRLRAAGNANLVLRAGDGATNSNVDGNDLFLAAEDTMTLRSATYSLQTSGSTITMTALNSSITMSTGSDSQGFINLRSAGTLTLDTTANRTNIAVLAGGPSSTSLTLRSLNGGIDLSSSSASGSGDIKLRSAGTLHLDTSANNTNILANTGQGRLVATSNNAGITAIQLLATNGGIDISTSGVGGLGELRLRSGGSLKIDTSGNNNNILVDSGTGDLLENVGTNTMTAQDDVIAAVGIRASRGGIQLSSSNANGNGDVRILSAGTLQLDTSATNSNILARTGTGLFNVTNTARSVQAIALLAGNGGIDLSTGNADGNGTLVLRSGGSLKIDTSGNNNNVLLTAGTGAFTVNAGASTHTYTGNYAVTDTAQISLTSNQAAINSIALLSTNGGIDISTSGVGGLGELRLRSGGSLKIDTSGNNNNVLVDSGTGDLLANVGTTTLSAVDDAIGAISLSATRGGINLSSSSASGSGDIKLRSAGTLHLDTSANNTNILANTGQGRLVATSNNAGITAIQLLATNGGIDISTSGVGGVGELRLRAGGSLKLDTSGNNNNILVDSGTGDLLANVGTTTLSAVDDAAAAIALRATRGGIDLSSSSASGNGTIVVRSAGTLQLDTSAANSTLLVRTGTGTVDVSSGLVQIRSANENLNAIRLLADRGGINISSGSAAGNGEIVIKSAGTLRLDTSATNANIMLRAGTGRIDLSGNTIVINSGAGTLDLTSNSTINIISSTNATLFGETGTFIGRAGQLTTAYGRMCIRGSDGGTACPAGSDGRLFVQVTGEVSDDPGDVFDLAEYYPASEAVDPGTVVVADSSARATVKKSGYPYQRVLGVVSTTPAIRINEGSFEVGGSAITSASTKPLVALVGRVPVKVTNENGAIKVGDRLVASSTAGSAMKAVKQGMTLGMALEDIDFAGAAEAKVMTFVNVSWYFPEVVAAIEAEHAQSTALGTVPDITGATADALVAAEGSDPSVNVAGSDPSATSPSVLGLAAPSLTVSIPPTEFPNITVADTLTVGKSLIVNGTAKFEGAVEVLSDATFQKSVIVVGNLRIGGNLEIAGAVVTSFTAGSSLSAGDPVSVNASGQAVRAGGTNAVIGVAAGNAGAGDKVNVAVAGKVAGLSGLSAGSRYYVSESGALTTDGKGGQSVGVAVSSSELLVQPGVGLPASNEPTPLAAPATPTGTPSNPAPGVQPSPTPTETPISPTVTPTPTAAPTEAPATPSPTPVP